MIGPDCEKNQCIEQLTRFRFMRTQHFSNVAGARLRQVSQIAGRAARRAGPSDPERSAILLVSDDAGLGQTLGCAAGQAGRTVVRVDGAANALRMMRVVRPAAVLLDLDSPAEDCWETADLLLRKGSCRPVILLTARSGQFDVRTAIRAGCLVDKSAGAARLLEMLDQTLAASDFAQSERRASQRLLIHWLRPCSWPVGLTPAYRFRGIDE